MVHDLKKERNHIVLPLASEQNCCHVVQETEGRMLSEAMVT